MADLRTPGFGGPGVGQHFKHLRRTDMCESLNGNVDRLTMLLI